MFEHLDDPNPPAVTGDIRHNVAHRADALKRRRTQIPLAIVSFLFVVGATGIVAATMHNSDEVKPSTTVVGRGSPRLTTSLALDSTRVAPGGEIRGSLVVVNTGGPLRVGNSCTRDWVVTLVKPGTRPDVVFDLMGCGAPGWNVPAGTSRFPFTVRASHNTCSTNPPSNPPCLAGGALPPLAAGQYLATFVPKAGGIPKPNAVPVTVAGPPIKIQTTIDLDTRLVRAGDTLHGTLMIVNDSGKALDLKSGGCTVKWAVALAKPGEKAEAAFTTECGAVPWRIPTGTTRLPFTVATTVTSCTQGPSSGSTPSCLPNNEMPPLPAGKYEAQFVSSGPAPELPVPVPVAVTVR